MTKAQKMFFHTQANEGDTVINQQAVWNRFVNMLPWFCALAVWNMLLLTVTPLKPGFLDRWCKKKKIIIKKLIFFPLVEKKKTFKLNRQKQYLYLAFIYTCSDQLKKRLRHTACCF